MTQKQLADSGLRVSVRGQDAAAGLKVSGPLPPRALSLVRERLLHAAFLMAGLTLANATLWLSLHPVLRDSPALLEVVSLVGIALALDAWILLEARTGRLDDQRMATLGLLYHVLRTFSVALYSVRLEVLLGWQPSPVTFASVTIAAFPLLVPTPARRLMGVSVLAGAAPPLVLWLHGVSLELLLQGTVYAAISVALAIFCGQVAYGLSAAVSRSAELGAYRLIEPLSRDREGALWRAEHRLLARPSAVKIIRPPRLLRRRFSRHLERFQREAQLATRLTSSHTVTVYDFGLTDDGSFYYARELLEGETLQQRVERTGPLPPLEVVRIALQVCDSLGEAHALGLVHRRLTPRQIFLCYVGRRDDYVKVLDFGLLDLQQRLRPDALGDSRNARKTADCLAPETIREDVSNVRTDIYQLGCVLRFLLTAEPARAVMRGPLQGPRQLRGAGEGVPADLELAVERCMAPSPGDRYAHVDELAAALRRLVRVAAAGDAQAPGRPRAAPASPAALTTAPPIAPSRRPARAEMELTEPLDKFSLLSFDAEGEEETLRPGAAPLGGRAAPAGGVMNVARHRLERFGTLMGVVTVVTLPLLALVRDVRSVDFAEVASLFVLLLVLDVALLLTARDRRVSNTATAHLAVGYFVVRVLVMSVLSIEVSQLLGVGPARLPFALVLLVILPFLVAVKPLQVLFASGGAAAAHPLAQLTLIHAPDSAVLSTSALNALTMLGASVACAYLVDGMRRAAGRGVYGSYRLTELLARGAMGEVWRAEHEMLARPAAVKLIAAGSRARRRAKAMHARFAREARVTARLTSPHTVTLYDYGVADDNTYYYVMELLEGQDLQRLVERRGPLSWQEAVAIGLQICDSLVEAHGLGLVHRDLKPANVFLARIGRSSAFVKVLDFGLAELEKELRSGAVERRGHRVVGTPGYLAPETLLEQNVDARADIYQLGCLLFFLMSGRLVFDRASVTALAVAHVREAPPAVSACGKDVPEELERIVTRCLAKAPDDRFASARELERDLQALVVRRDVTPAEADSVTLDLLPVVFKPDLQSWSRSEGV